VKRFLVVSGLLFVSLIFFLPTLAAMRQVEGLFGEARYDEALQMLQSGSENTHPGEEDLWRSRLSTAPDAVTEILSVNLNDQSIPESTRQGMGLQLAQIYFARSEFQKAHAVLKELIATSTNRIPGEVYLLAGLTERTSGNLQGAREMFASVKPDDPAFGAARYYLGDIGLETNEHELALRYFESGQKDASEEDFSRLKAGQWRALRIAGRDTEAESILRELQRDSATSLALVEIGRVLQLEEDENSARLASNVESEPDSLVARPVDNTGRYSLQVGAFSDRGLALEFKYSYQDQLPDLSITQLKDHRGQFLYKVRFGSFVNPARARSEAQRQKKRLGIDVIVVDLSTADSDR